MTHRMKFIVGFLALCVAATAIADTKMVQESHQDAFSVMGQAQPATDSQRVIWIGDDRLRMDESGGTFIVRLDLDKMFIVDHGEETVSAIDLPIDLGELLPAGVADQMLSMLKFEVDVSPTEETKMVGPWKARRYDVTMPSAMVTVENTMWVTNDVELDRDAYHRTFHQIISLQPGMENVLDTLKSIDGFAVEEETTTRMAMAGDAEMKSHDVTVSVETLDPPMGIYDPPATYTEKEFDLMAAMQAK